MLGGAGVTVLEGDADVVSRSAACRLGIAGTKGFGGGFAGACGSDFGEPEMKAFVAATRSALADALGGRSAALDTDVRVALLHYAPVTRHAARASGSRSTRSSAATCSAEAIDRAGADLVLHGHAHGGSEKGVTPGRHPRPQRRAAGDQAGVRGLLPRRLSAGRLRAHAEDGDPFAVELVERKCGRGAVAIDGHADPAPRRSPTVASVARSVRPATRCFDPISRFERVEKSASRARGIDRVVVRDAERSTDVFRGTSVPPSQLSTGPGGRPFELSIDRKSRSVARTAGSLGRESLAINVSNRKPVPPKRAIHFGGFVDAAAVM